MWTIKEFAEKTFVSPVALRYYDKTGILPTKRLENGYRFYDEEDLLIMKNLVVLKYAGFSLEDIKILTSLYNEPEGQACNDTANEVLRWNLTDMKDRIDMLQQIVAIIEELTPLFDNHELYKVNQLTLEQQINELFDQINQLNAKADK
ncbi:MerR family transcriptional regulator [Enterococcus sp. AZ196]|uniref:MerR family transcriptional regulator n=1 Tax=Enterococcus sp. AZ196 TaxID=2774659 RepID=UPI003D268C17